MSTTRATTTRRTFVLSGVLLTLGAVLGQEADAKTNIGSIRKRVADQRALCESHGGTLSVKKSPFGARITTCKEGSIHGRHCVNTKKNTYCRSKPPKHLETLPEENPGTPPSDGVNEDPTNGGGANPGGGGHVPPGGGVDPGEGGSTGPVLE
jgi:hypothetical protein